MASFETLLERYLAAEATAEDLADFEALLRGDADKRRQLAQRCLLEIELRKAMGGVLPAEPSMPLPMARGRLAQHAALWVIAASVLLAVGAYLMWPSSHDVGIVSGKVQIDGAAAERIPTGATFDVTPQLPAVVRLADASRVELDASSKAAFQGPRGDARQVVELKEGGGVFEVADNAGEFRVETPAGNVTTLGTSFSLKLKPRRPSAATKGTHSLTVAVLTGKVRVDADGQSVVLGPKTTRVFGDDGQQNNNDDGQKNNKGTGNQGNGQNGNK